MAPLLLLGALPLLPCVAQDTPAASYFPHAFDEDVVLYPALTAAQRAQLIEDYREVIRHQQEAIAVYEAAERRDGVDNSAPIARARATMLDAQRRMSALAAQRAQEAIRVATRGQATDIGALRGDITVILQAARTNQLMGNDEGQAQQAEAIRVVRVFSENFARTCSSQSFDHLEAMGLQRQNEMLGTGIDLKPCANRLLEASIRAPTGSITWRHCGMGVGDWKMRSEGYNVGDGSADIERSGAGDYSAHWSNLGGIKADIDQNGRLEMRRLEQRDAGGHVTAARYQMRMVSASASGKLYPPIGGRSIPVHEAIEPAGPLPVEIVNDNRPCDPEKDVWKY